MPATGYTECGQRRLPPIGFAFNYVSLPSAKIKTRQDQASPWLDCCKMCIVKKFKRKSNDLGCYSYSPDPVFLDSPAGIIIIYPSEGE
jgi:hypothetical protein